MESSHEIDNTEQTGNAPGRKTPQHEIQNIKTETDKNNKTLADKNNYTATDATQNIYSHKTPDTK